MDRKGQGSQSSEARYLPILTEDFQLIPRPDYMVLAALSDPEPDGMRQIYETMMREQELRPHGNADEMTALARLTKSKLIEGKTQARVLAGQVVLELVRIAQATGKPPTIKNAHRLVAFNHNRTFPKGTLASVVREVEKQFSEYRNVAHLWAAAIYEEELGNIEGNERALHEFLGRARAFEAFVDNNVVSGRFRWNPFRIPDQFPAIWTLLFAPHRR